MHFKRMLILSGAVVLAVVLVSAAGARSSAPRHLAKIDVSTRAAAVNYLRSIHVNPRGLVIQRGARNYAGPNCPGKGWTCTSTGHAVVQIASAGGKNSFQCASAHCAVVQAAEAPAVVNTAKCVKTSGVTQTCSISQTSASADNLAIVYMNVLKTTGLTQDASQVATIVQQATGGATVHNNNRACVSQIMTVDTSTVAQRGMPVVATLDGHQTLTLKQDSSYGNNNASEAATSASGGSCDSNTSHLLGQNQIIKQTATGSARITQNENTHDQGPNLLLDIAQNQNGGGVGPNNLNNAAFLQDNTLTAIAKTAVGPVIQTQVTPNGGLTATVNQFAHGISNADAHQHEVQCAHATATGALNCVTGGTVSYTRTQTQWGPVRKGDGPSTQGDNGGDTFGIDQQTTQDNDTEHNQRNVVQADCLTTGGCSAGQTATVNGDQSQNNQSGQNVNAETQCASSNCTTFTANGPQLSASETNIKEFGFGGMRGDGTGTITVSGVTGPVARAILYWNGPTNSSDPAANANVTFNGSAVTGTNTGFASSNCWPFANSQSYQADVTGLLDQTDPNQAYSLSNFHVPPDVEINGVSLVVFYNDTDASNDRNITLWSGNDSNVASTFDPADWDETLTGVEYPGAGAASLDFIVSDGQNTGDSAGQDGEIDVNGFTFVPQGDIFSGDSTPAGGFTSDGDLWDVKSFTGLESFLAPGTNTIQVTSPIFGDCLSLVAVAANVPASAPPPGPSRPQAPQSSAPNDAAQPPVTGVPSGGTISR